MRESEAAPAIQQTGAAVMAGREIFAPVTVISLPMLSEKLSISQTKTHITYPYMPNFGRSVYTRMTLTAASIIL